MQRLITEWQSATFRGVNFWFYASVNKYLRTRQIDASKDDLKKMQFKNSAEFEDYIIDFVNKFTRLVYNSPEYTLSEQRIFYRGESRDIAHKTGDLIYYNQFMSVTSEISYAMNFMRNRLDTTLFIICIPSGFSLPPINKDAKLQWGSLPVTVNEYEYLLLPCAYFHIVDIEKIISPSYTGVRFKIVKMRLVYQDQYTLDKTKKYRAVQVPDYSDRGFADGQLTVLHKQLKQHADKLKLTKFIPNELPIELITFIAINAIQVGMCDPGHYTIINTMVSALEGVDTRPHNFIKSLKDIIKKYKISLWFIPSYEVVADHVIKGRIKNFKNFISKLPRLKKLKFKRIHEDLIGESLYTSVTKVCDHRLYHKIFTNILQAPIGQRFAQNDYLYCSFDKAPHMDAGMLNNFYPGTASLDKHSKGELCYSNIVLEIKITTQNALMIKPEKPKCIRDSDILLSLFDGYVVKSSKKIKNKHGLPVRYITLEI